VTVDPQNLTHARQRVCNLAATVEAQLNG
jgi:hypothetical protein